MFRRLNLAAVLIVSCCVVGGEEVPAAAPKYAQPPMPALRVEAKPFNAGEADIKAVCVSSGREIWKYFPEYKIDAIVVRRNQGGPKVLYDRTTKGEIAMWLNTGDTYWSQYAYQFGHEFCHVLCGFREEWQGNKWFEETLCEMASLFALRAMSRAWETDPPYAHWKSHRVSLAKYAQDVIDKREKLTAETLAAFYEKHREELVKESCNRELNGTMAVVLLKAFEAQPESWEAVRWLNSGALAREGDTFPLASTREPSMFISGARDPIRKTRHPVTRYRESGCPLLGKSIRGLRVSYQKTGRVVWGKERNNEQIHVPGWLSGPLYCDALPGWAHVQRRRGKGGTAGHARRTGGAPTACPSRRPDLKF